MITQPDDLCRIRIGSLGRQTRRNPMKSTFVLLVAIAGSLPAFSATAILPGVIGPWKQVSSTPLEVTSERPLWDEYGLQDAAQGTYQNAGKTLLVQAWRLADSTDSLGAFEVLRPADARRAPAELEELTPNAALTGTGALVALGNYVVRFEGAVPQPDDVANMFRSMPRYEHAALPTFTTYLPDGALPNSGRYIGGPVALHRFAPEIDASAVGFHFGAEAAVAEYKPDLKLALFSYPTPAIARNREGELSKIPGSVVKRSGPLVAVVMQTKDQNAAERLLAQIRYQAVVTTGEKPASPKDNPGNLLLNVFYLIVILMGFCLASGLLFGVFRMIFRRSGSSGDGEEILSLHLGGR
jgi:hypothetical protein